MKDTVSSWCTGEFTEMMNDIRLGRAELIEREPGRRAIHAVSLTRVLEAGLRRPPRRQGRHRAGLPHLVSAGKWRRNYGR